MDNFKKRKTMDNFKKLGRNTLLVHYVYVSSSFNSKRVREELESYKRLVDNQLKFKDVFNLYIPQSFVPTHIEHLIN